MTAPGVDALLGALLTAPASTPPVPCPDVKTWKTLWRGLTPRWPVAIDRAVMGGTFSDRLAWAFAAGYQGAICRMLPEVPVEALSAVCITESGGAHPRAIETRLVKDAATAAFCLNGEKRFISGGAQADLLVVASSLGHSGGRNRIRVALVDRRADGVLLEPMPPLPIVPEIPHASARFDNVVVATERVLPGDGYTGCIKPFRTIEDIHVVGGVLGYLFGVGRRWNWPPSMLERMLAQIVSLRALAAEDPLAPGIHLALAGVFGQLQALLADTDALWARIDEDTARRWQRDRGLLNVANRARDARQLSAWRQFDRTV